MEGVTPAYPLNGQPSSPYEPEPLNGDKAVFGACGDIATTRGKERRNGGAIHLYRAERGVFGQRSNERQTCLEHRVHLLVSARSIIAKQTSQALPWTRPFHMHCSLYYKKPSEWGYGRETQLHSPPTGLRRLALSPSYGVLRRCATRHSLIFSPQ